MDAWTNAIIDTSSYTGTHMITLYGNDDQGGGEIYIDDISAPGTTGITAWAWDFDNNGVTDSTVQNPEYTYSSAGTYSVKLAVTDANGNDEELKTDYITVSPAVVAPVAAFSGTPTSGTAPLTVTFTDESTNDPTSWAWTFGDGGTSDQQNPVYTYTSAGTYTVTLTASNSAGSDMETATIEVTAGVIALPGFTDLPTDPDGDGFYEDVTGNGITDFPDVQTYFKQMDWIAENEPITLFDYNGSGTIDFPDIQLLFKEV